MQPCRSFLASGLQWVPAKRFHEQLSQLAVSEDNISSLRRLEARIEEGVDAERYGAAPHPHENPRSYTRAYRL